MNYFLNQLDKNKVERIDEMNKNISLVQSLVQQLSDVFVGQLVQTSRLSYSLTMEFGEDGNYFARIFVAKDNTVEFSSQVRYHSLPTFGLTQIGYDGEISGEQPAWLKLKCHKDSGCGNMYEMSFTLNESEPDFFEKISWINKICEANSFYLKREIPRR